MTAQALPLEETATCLICNGRWEQYGPFWKPLSVRARVCPCQHYGVHQANEAVRESNMKVEGISDGWKLFRR